MQVTSQGACGKLWQVLVVVQPVPVLQWLYRRHQEKAKNSLNPAWHWEPWCRVPVMALRDVREQQPRGMPKFFHLSCSWSAWKPRAVRSKEFQTSWRSYFSPREPPAGLQPPFASPAGAAQEGSLANWWVLHLCCCLWHVCKHCFLTELVAMS